MRQRDERLRSLRTELDVLAKTADRSDPVDEALLCLAEAAVLVLTAAERGPAPDHESAHRERDLLLRAVASTRAAVGAVAFAATSTHNRLPAR